MKQRIFNGIFLIIVAILVLLFDWAYGYELTGSYSARSCILDGYPFDYEYRVSLSGEKCNINVLHEREVGVTGVGLDLWVLVPIDIKFNETKLITETNMYLREVKDMDYESISCRYPFKIDEFDWKMGFSLNMVDWFNAPKFLFSLDIRYKDIASISLETNFDTRQILCERLSKRIYLDKKEIYFIEPMWEYRIADSREDWWLKTIIGMKIVGKKKIVIKVGCCQ